MSWTLTNKSANKTKSFEEWGIKNPIRTLISLGIDTFTFETGEDFDVENSLPLDSELIILKDDVPWFSGRVDQTPRTATGKYESHGYVVVGPWYDVRDITFQSEWNILTNPLNPDAGLTAQRTSHVILNMDIFGRSIYTTKVQIYYALLWPLLCADATGRNRPYQLDLANIDVPEFRPWLEDVVDQKCADVVQRQLRWTPDVVGWFDYTTTPPKIHVKQRSALTVANLQFGVPPLAELKIKPRTDLQVSEVCLKYEQVNIVNGVGYLNLVTDAYPPGATGKQRGAICQTITLQGSEVSYSFAEIVCAPILEASADWWKSQYAPLADPSVADVEITEYTRSTALPRYLISGNITGWMLARAHATANQELIEAKANWKVKDGDNVLQENKEKAIKTELVSTDLTSGIYLSSISESPGDPVPVNAAQSLYNATSFLHYDGQVTLSEDECTGSISVGNVVNIDDSVDAHAAMRAVVQSISEDIDAGRTTITLGPPKHLGLDDIVEFLRGNRNRQRYTAMSAMTDGQSFTATPTDIGKQSAKKNSNADNGKLDKLVVAPVISEQGALTGGIILNRADNPAAREVKLRELLYCDNGVQKKILALASLPYL